MQNKIVFRMLVNIYRQTIQQKYFLCMICDHAEILIEVSLL